ncbi:MAG: hypothetical protein ACXVIV_02515 [Halobacteriota archaeon]
MEGEPEARGLIRKVRRRDILLILLLVLVVVAVISSCLKFF